MSGGCAASSAHSGKICEIYDQLNWLYKTLPPCTSMAHRTRLRVSDGCRAYTGLDLNDPALRNDDVAFFNDVQRGYRQTAFFTRSTSTSFPKVLTITAERAITTSTTTRRARSSEHVLQPSACFDAGPAPCTTTGHQHQWRKPAARTTRASRAAQT